LSNRPQVETGYGAVNSIEVKYDGSSTFTIWFNGISVFSFSDTMFDGGLSGFAAGIGADEDFPNTPVDLRYYMTSPVSLP